MPASLSLLSAIALPSLGALAVVFTPRRATAWIRGLATLSTLATLAVALPLWTVEDPSSGWLGEIQASWLSRWGSSIHLGLDGFSRGLFFLTVVLCPLTLAFAWLEIDRRVKEFAAAFLLLESVLLASFSAVDLLLFYVLFEMSLLPVVWMMAGWGAANAKRAGLRMFAFTLLGSLALLVVMVAVAAGPSAGFSLPSLQGLSLPKHLQLLLFPLFFLAFAIKLPLFPFHGWLPSAYGTAPYAVTALMSGLTSKLAVYGMYRFGLVVFPAATYWLAPSLAALAMTGALWGALCAWSQRDIKGVFAYASLSHLAFVALGLLALTPVGIAGAGLHALGHGITSAALFLALGVAARRDASLTRIDEGRGLARTMPVWSTVMAIAVLSGLGLPGTVGFAGEFSVLLGAFLADSLYPWPWIFVGLGVIALVLAAAYMLRVLHSLLWGDAAGLSPACRVDLGWREGAILLPLALLIVGLGLRPQWIMSRVIDSASRYSAELSQRMAPYAAPTAVLTELGRTNDEGLLR